MSEPTIESAIAALQAGNLAEAERIARELLARDGAQFDPLSIAGISALNLDRAIEAVVDLEHAAKLRPEVAAAHVNLAEAYRKLGRSRQAIESLRRAIALEPASIDFRNRLAGVLLDQRDFAAAVACFRELVKIDRSHRSLSGLAFALRKTGETKEAVALSREAFAQAPNDQAAHLELVAALFADHQDEEARRGLSRHRAISPGMILDRVGRYTDAALAYEVALHASPSSVPEMLGLAATAQRAGRWDLLQANTQNLAARFPDEPAMQSISIFTALYDPDATAASIAFEHDRWWKAHGQARFDTPRHDYDNDREPHRPLRIGYISPDLREHPISFFIEPILRAHHGSAAETFVYSDVARPDAVTARLRSLPVTWRDIAKLADDALDQQIRSDRIDILVDLTQHLGGNRLTLFARKPAPLQVSYLAYPYSTGLESIDYRLSDPHLDPPDRKPTGPEEIARLPESYFCYSPPEDAPAIEPLDPPSRANGLVTFGSMNQLIKMNARVYDAWAKILNSVPNARLLAKAQALEDPVARDRFLEEFAKRNVTADRIEMQGISPLPIAMAEFCKRADVMLDTFPYPGGTTSCHLLYMGLPVVSIAGELPFHRMGASLLHQVGLRDLVGKNAEDFVRIAIDLARDEDRRRSLRQTLRETMRPSPLMDAAKFTRAIESLYRQMWHKLNAR